jgi:hypothetical protein
MSQLVNRWDNPPPLPFQLPASRNKQHLIEYGARSLRISKFSPFWERNVNLSVGHIVAPFVEQRAGCRGRPLRDRLFIISGRDSRWACHRNIKLAELVDETRLWAPGSSDRIQRNLPSERFARPRGDADRCAPRRTRLPAGYWTYC